LLPSFLFPAFDPGSIAGRKRNGCPDPGAGPRPGREGCDPLRMKIPGEFRPGSGPGIAGASAVF